MPTVNSRLDALEAFRRDVESWHIPGKLSKVAQELDAQGTALDLHHAEIATLQAQIATLQARVAALEAQIGDPQTAAAR